MDIGNSTIELEATCNWAKIVPGSEFEQPRPGNVYVVVQLTLKNTGSVDYDYNPLDFYLMDSNGNLTNTDIATGVLPDEMSYGSLAPGGTITGKLLFQMPKDDHGAQLAWQPTRGTPKSKFTWKLGL